MSQANPGVLYDATNSWNGYNHQGKIALYYAVEEIIKLLEASRDEKDAEAKLQSTFLEIEWTEDFSIGEIDASGVKQYHTIHQVKDRQDTELTKYESAIQGLAVNMVEHPEIQKAYLHVTTELEIDPEDKQFSDEVKKYINNLKWIDDWIKEENKKASKRIKVLQKKYRKITTQKAKKAAILLERDQKIAPKQQLKSQLLSLARDPMRVADIEVFKYELDGTAVYCCHKEKAKELLKKSLENFYRFQYPDKEYKHEKKYIDKSYQYILIKLNDNIVYRSQHRNDDDVKREISFSDIVSWLTTDEIENMGEEYYLYYIKAGYFEYLEQLCGYCESEYCGSCQVNSFKERFKCMQSKELRVFAHQTNPHAPKEINIASYPKFLQELGIESPFWMGLHNIKLTPEGLSCGNTVRYIGSDKKHYMLTTIAVPRNGLFMEQKIKTICTEIWKKRKTMDLDCNYLISDGVEVMSLRDGAVVIGPHAMCGDENKINEQDTIKIVPLERFISGNT